MSEIMDEQSERFFTNWRARLGLIARGSSLKPLQTLISPHRVHRADCIEAGGNHVAIYECDSGVTKIRDRVDDDSVYVAELAIDDETSPAIQFPKYYFKSKPQRRDITQSRELLALREDLAFGHLSTTLACPQCGNDRHWVEVPTYARDAPLATRRHYLKEGICGCTVSSEANSRYIPPASRGMHEK